MWFRCKRALRPGGRPGDKSVGCVQGSERTSRVDPVQRALPAAGGRGPAHPEDHSDEANLWGIATGAAGGLGLAAVAPWTRGSVRV
eukprot:1876816-Alexandrium_andersonii.AAC.1